MDLDRRGSNKDLKFSRRYLDANRVTYEASYDSYRQRIAFSLPTYAIVPFTQEVQQIQYSPRKAHHERAS